MEVIINVLLVLALILLGFIAGLIVGAKHKHQIDGGQIIFSPGEEGPKCTFKLNYTTEELMQKFYVVLKVVHTNDSSNNGTT